MNDVSVEESILTTITEECLAIDPSQSEPELLRRLSFALLIPLQEASDFDSINSLASRGNSFGMSIIQSIAFVAEVFKENWLPANSHTRLFIRTQELALSPKWLMTFGGDGADKLNVDIDIREAVKRVLGRSIHLRDSFWWEYPIIHASQALYMCDPKYSLQAHLCRVRESLRAGRSLELLTEWLVTIFGLPLGRCDPDKPVAHIFGERLVQDQKARFILHRAHAFAEVCALCLGVPVKKTRQSIMKSVEHHDTFRAWAEERFLRTA